MAKDKNFLTRAFDALVIGRENAARRFVAQFQREYRKDSDKFTKW